MNSTQPDSLKFLTIELPSWVDPFVAAYDGSLHDDAGRMRLAIALSRENLAHGGGPFGALVLAGNRVLGAAVNWVLPSGLSIAHAEILALMRAESRHGLGANSPLGPWTLVTSTEPCCQCFGALIWAGISRLVCGATTEDAEAIGFDEGPKPKGWVQALGQRGIKVARGVQRDEAKRVLQEYKARGGTIYGN